MKHLVPTVTVLAAVFIPAPAPAQQAPTRIAVVSPQRVEKESKWAASLLLGIEREYAANKESLRKLEADLQKKRKEQEMWLRGSEEHDQLRVAILRLENDLRNRLEMYRGWYQRKKSAAYLTILDEIKKNCEKLAKKRGYDLVLKKLEVPKDKPAVLRLAPEQVSAIVFAAPHIDLTSIVASLIDAAHAKGVPADASSSGKTPNPKPSKE